MKTSPCLTGALLIAAPLFSQMQAPFDPAVKNGKLLWFLLGETRDQVARLIGPPAVITGFGDDFVSWQYRIGDRDDEEYSHYFVFRKSDGKLLSVTRNYDDEHDVSALFPAPETTIHVFHGGEGSIFHVAVRRLNSGSLLLAMGSARPDDPVRQIVLIRASELQHFHPWLHQQLTHSGK